VQTGPGVPCEAPPNKIAEDCLEAFWGRLEDVWIMHKQFEVQFKKQTWYQWKLQYLHWWGYGKYNARAHMDTHVYSIHIKK